MALLELMKTHEFLKGLPRPSLAKLAALAREVKFERDEIILKAGQPSTSFYLLVSGSACIEVSRPVYAICIQTLGPGDAFGWSALLNEHYTVFQVRAREPVTAIVLDGPALAEICAKDAKFAAEFYRRLAELVAKRVKAVELRLAEFLGSSKELVTQKLW